MLDLSKTLLTGNWFGLWNGKSFDFETKPSKLATGLSFLARFGVLGHLSLMFGFHILRAD